MDLHRMLQDVQFKEQWRGYSTREVDEFLADVAQGVAELQDQLRQLQARISEDDEVRRTLVLAQRTAATAVEEAKADAARLIEAAKGDRARVQADIDALLEHARAQRERLRAELRRQLAELDEPLPVEASPVGDPTETFDVLADEDAEDAEDDRADIEWQEPHDDDAFLAELRRAVTDDEPLGPREHDVQQFRPHDDPLPSGRFRLRRQR